MLFGVLLVEHFLILRLCVLLYISIFVSTSIGAKAELSYLTLVWLRSAADKIV